MQPERWDEGTAYLRSTDKEGRVTFTEHRCWNRGLFLQTVMGNALVAGGVCVMVPKVDYDQAMEKFKRK